jgi:hypothetical protein
MRRWQSSGPKWMTRAAIFFPSGGLRNRECVLIPKSIPSFGTFGTGFLTIPEADFDYTTKEFLKTIYQKND